MKVRRALISVSDKTGLDEFAKGLSKLGIEIVSTGGTAEKIRSLGIEVTDISDYTGYPEMLDGRVKTLNPVIHAGILALRGNNEHEQTMKEKGIPYIDMVVVNLYPFEATIAQKDVALEEAIENIDIGGPTMLRSAAKNYMSVAVVSSPEQYENVLGALRNGACTMPRSMLMNLAVEVFRKTSGYDRAITKYLARVNDSNENISFPEFLEIDAKKVMDLRYGENPHQKAAFYREGSATNTFSIANVEQISGKQLSFNNIMDINSALEMVSVFKKPASIIVKHTNPCGAAMADSIEKAYIDALDCDKQSAFGSIMAFNAPITGKLGSIILDESVFIECIIAPDYDEESLNVLKSKPNLRILKLPSIAKGKPAGDEVKNVAGGFLVQDSDMYSLTRDDIKVVTDASPDEKQMDSLLFAWDVVKYVKSNAIVLCQGTKTVGIGAGQMSRVDSVITSVRKAGTRVKGAVLASDAFFPMPDSIEKAHGAGISAIIQPGGSIRDKDVVAACNKYGIPMVFTGIRHFKH